MDMHFVRLCYEEMQPFKYSDLVPSVLTKLRKIILTWSLHCDAGGVHRTLVRPVG